MNPTISGDSGQAVTAVIALLKQRMLARAAPRFTHDLNNDLTIIAGQAELAQRQGEQGLQHRMEQIKLAARNARERNELIQQIAGDGVDTEAGSTGGAIAGDAIVEEVRRLAALLGHRNLGFETSAKGALPNIARARLRWITGAVLIAAQPGLSEIRGRITMAMTRGGGGLRIDCRAEGLELADWLSPTLVHCATAADVTAHEHGWRALILLGEAL